MALRCHLRGGTLIVVCDPGRTSVSMQRCGVFGGGLSVGTRVLVALVGAVAGFANRVPRPFIGLVGALIWATAYGWCASARFQNLGR